MKNKSRLIALVFMLTVLLSCFQAISASDIQLPFTQSQGAEVTSSENNVKEDLPTSLETNVDVQDSANTGVQNENLTLEERKYGRYKPEYVEEPSFFGNWNENIYFKYMSAPDYYMCTHEYYKPTKPNIIPILTNQHPSMIKCKHYGKVFCVQGGYGLYLDGKVPPVESTPSNWDTDTGWNIGAYNVNSVTYSDEIPNRIYRIATDYYGKSKVDNNHKESAFTQMAMWNKLPLANNFSEGSINGKYLSYFTAGAAAEYKKFLEEVINPQLSVWYKKPSFSMAVIELKAGEVKNLSDSSGTLRFYETFSFVKNGITVMHQKGSDILTVAASSSASSTDMTENELKAAGACKYPDKSTELYYTFTHAERQNLVHCNGRVNPQSMSLSFKVDSEGYAQVKKTVATDEALTSLCPEQYTLEGAEYTVYKDEGCTIEAGKLVTGPQKKGADGKFYAVSSSLNLKAGTYYVKETAAPKGYRKDPANKKYTLTVKTGETSILNVSDSPMFDPMTLILQKQIPSGHPEFQKYLEGAEYTVKYYASYLNNQNEVSSKTPLRTWVFRTDVNGIIKFDEKWKIGGNPLFKNQNGIIVGLYGTYTFEETKAPPGFKKNEGLDIRHIRQGIPPENVNATNSPIFSELPDLSLKRRLIVKKRIPDGHIFAPFGYPSVIFEVDGRDIYGNCFKLRKCIILGKESYNIADKSYCGEVVFENLPPGEYTVREIMPARYRISRIFDISKNGTVRDNKVDFELVSTEEGTVTYENVISKWNDLSHIETIVNLFRPVPKLK